MDYITQFIDAMAGQGLAPDSASDIKPTNGRWKQYRLAGDKRSAMHGGYRLTIDEIGAVGQFKDYRDGTAHTWNSRAHKEASAEEREAYRKKMQQMRDDDAKKRAEEYAEAATEAKKIWTDATPAIDHPYLRAKGIQAHGAKMDAGGNLILPRYDFAGKLWSVQSISPEHPYDKKFQFQGKSSGVYMPLAAKDDDRSVIIITEGFATGASIREATGCPVIVAYTAGNLLDVAKLAKKKYPDARFIVAADNDQFSFKNPRAEAVQDIDKADIPGDDPRWIEWREAGYLYNTGIEKAQAAAYAIGAAVLWPEFDRDDLQKKPTDWNDYHKLYGLEAVQFKFKPLIKPPAEEGPPLEAYDYNRDAVSVPDIDWMSRIIWKNEKTGEYHKDFCLNNAEVILSHKAPIGGCFVLDTFLNKKTVVRPLPWDEPKGFYVREVTNNDIVRVQTWLELQGIKLGKSVVNDVLELVCANNTINPAIDYLDALVWDKQPRLDKWLAYYMGAEDQPAEYLARVGACWIIAAAKRIYNPGTPFHHMLVLEGGQGAMKSTSLRALATFGKDKSVAYFSDRITFEMIDRADFATHADGNVILEFQELSGMGKKDRNKIKQWITQDTDEFRRPYDHITTKFPRKFVLAGTTNESQYLNDPTGDRRFWPVRVGRIDIEALRRDKEQLWAEAVFRAKAGELWYIEPNDPVYKMMQAEQSVRFSGDVWEDIILNYLSGKNHVKPDDILADVLKIETGRRTNGDKARVTDILKRAGFENKTVRDPYSKKTIRAWARAEPQKTELFEEEIEF